MIDMFIIRKLFILFSHLHFPITLNRQLDSFDTNFVTLFAVFINTRRCLFNNKQIDYHRLNTCNKRERRSRTLRLSGALYGGEKRRWDGKICYLLMLNRWRKSCRRHIFSLSSSQVVSSSWNNFFGNKYFYFGLRPCTHSSTCAIARRFLELSFLEYWRFTFVLLRAAHWPCLGFFELLFSN